MVFRARCLASDVVVISYFMKFLNYDWINSVFCRLCMCDEFTFAIFYWKEFDLMFRDVSSFAKPSIPSYTLRFYA